VKVFITGVAGFLGSEIARQAHAAGWRVSGCDSLVTGFSSRVPAEVGWVRCRVEQLSRIDADVVIHTAAIPRSAWPTTADLWQANVVSTAHIVDVCAGSARIIHCSSSIAAHPEASPYARTKAAAEAVMLDAGAVVLRPGNIYGAGQSQKGAAPNVLAAFARCARDHGQVTVDGTGEQTRDFVHVADVAAAFCAAAASDVTPTDPVDVCSGHQTSIRELAYLFGVPVRFGPSRGDPQQVTQDPGPARRLFGWQATTPFAEGILEVLP
jgi:UDP-glucose 4-epimerase